MPADVKWTQGDTEPIYSDSLVLSDGTVPPYQLGATVVPQMRSLADATVRTLTGKVTFDENTGNVTFAPSTADTAIVGNFLFNWIVTFTSGDVMTFPTDGYVWVEVQANLAAAPQLIVSLPEVKEHLLIPHADRTRDTRLIGLIQTVTPLIEAQTGPIIPKVYEEWFDGGANIHDVLRQPSSGFGTSPVFRVLAASEYRGPIEYPLSLVASPAFGSIYSIFVDMDMGTVTRRTVGGGTLAFMPGRQQIHIVYEAGQSRTPDNVAFAAKEAVRVAWEWTRQVGRGSQAPADTYEAGPALAGELTRVIRTFLSPTRRFPAIA